MIAPRAALLGLVLFATGCADQSGSAEVGGPERLQVAAGFYPLFEAARAVGGEEADVVDLTPPGTGPHDLDLTPKAAATVERADLVLHLGNGFQPAVERAAERTRGQAVDLLRGARLRPADKGIPGVRGEVDGERLAGNQDPHVWVDPVGFAALVDRMRDAFIAADPARRATWERNAARYRRPLEDLHRAFRRTLKDCATRTVVTSHAAFGYLTDRYGLEQAAIAGISPDDEPDPQSLAAVARRARADGVRTVFFETLVPRDLSETVAREIGARTDALDPVEGVDEAARRAGRTYVSIQRDNLRRLARGLACTTA